LIAALAAVHLAPACLGGFGDGPSFLDEGVVEIQDPFDARLGEFCRATADCRQGLRCLQDDEGQYCVETCRASQSCESGDCNEASNDASQGWCGLDGLDDGYEDFVGDDGLGDEEAGEPARPVVEGPGTDGACGSPIESEQFRLMNADRRADGLAELRCDLRLSEVARDHSQDMALRDFFDHTNPDGEQPWDRMERHGIRGFTSAGENIAAGYPSAADVQEGWMNSPGHRANILNGGFTHIGVGLFDDGDRLVWTQVFAIF
jgi:hypothetical protein